MYYPFKNGSLENIITGSIATNNGAVFNNSLSKDSYYFSGIDDGMNVGTCNLTDNYTISIWFYKSSWGTDPWETLFSLGGAELETKNGSNNIATIVAYSWGGGTFTYDFDKWNHLVMTRNATETKYYLNNELRLTGQPGGYGNINILLACWNSTSSQNYKGYISNFRVYNHILSQTEITQLYTTSNLQTKIDLIAHYPLNGNTDDYSAYGNDLINNGAVIDNNGKIGKCYSCNDLADYFYSLNDVDLGGNISMFGWFFISSISDTTMSGIFTNHDYTVNANIGMNVYIVGTQYKLTCSIGYMNETREYNLKLGNSLLDYNKWYNLGIIYDRNNDTIRFYVNGVEDGSWILSSKVKNLPRKIVISRWSVNYDGYKVLGKFNDLRIYNKVLSTKEIKEIAKAKILHYNFNDFQEPTQNYDILTNSNYAGCANSYGSYCTITNGNYYGKDCYKIVLNVPAGTVFNSWQGAYFNMTSGNLATKGFINGDWVTRSFDVYIESHNNINYARPHLSIEGNSTSKSYNQIDKTKLGTWQRVSCTSQIVDITQTNNYLFYVASHNTGTTTTDLRFVVYMGNAQLEKKSYATPYTPTTRTGQVQDSSGYRNHADILATKTPQWTELSKIGTGCYYWGTDKIRSITQSINVPTDAITMNCWFKVKTPTTAGFASYHIPMVIDSSYHEMSISPSGALRVGFHLSGTRYVNDHGSGLLDGNWHMLTTIYDGTSKKGYIDGVLVGNITTGGTLTSGTQALQIGEYSNNDYGNKDAYQDDVRIYATALSQEDISELYEVGQQIHNTGILETNEVIENGYSSLTNYNKTWIPGQVATGWSNNGAAVNNSRVTASNPVGETDIVWKGMGDATGGGNSGYVSNSYPVDPTKKYRFSVWIKRELIQTSPTHGYIYHGLYGYNGGSNIGLYYLNGSGPDTNPYFWSRNNTNDNNIWRLWVGYVLPHNTTITTNDPENGIYNIDGTKDTAITDYKWHHNTTQASIRNYLYYSSDPNTYVYFYRPRIDLIDGTEPTLQELLKCQDHKPFPLIQPEFSEKHCTYINKYKEAFTTGITFIRDDSEVSQQLYCDYFEGEVYAKTLSGTFVVKGTIFTTIAQKIDINQFYDRVVANMDNNIIYVNKLIEN